MAEWPGFLQNDYKRQQFFQQIGRFGAGLLQGSNTYSRQPVNAWAYGANALGQSMPGPGEALKQQLLQEQLKGIQAKREQQKRFADYLTGAGPSGQAKVGTGASSDALRAQAAKIAAIAGPEAAQKWYLSQIGKEPKAPGRFIQDANGKWVLNPLWQQSAEAVARAGASSVSVKLEAEYRAKEDRMERLRKQAAAATDPTQKRDLTDQANAIQRELSGSQKLYGPAYVKVMGNVSMGTQAAAQLIGVVGAKDFSYFSINDWKDMAQAYSKLLLAYADVTNRGANLTGQELGKIQAAAGGDPSGISTIAGGRSGLLKRLRRAYSDIVNFGENYRHAATTGRPRIAKPPPPTAVEKSNRAAEEKYKKWLK